MTQKSIEFSQSRAMLDELYETVNAATSKLSSGDQRSLTAEAINQLCKTEVTFGNPRAELARLTPKLFEEIGVQLTELQKRQMSAQYNYYTLALAVSMQPGRGVQFSRLECRLEFGPKGEQEPIVHTISPTSEWHDVLSWGGGMRLSLDGDLKWRLQTSHLPEGVTIENLPDFVEAGLGTENQMNSYIAVKDFSFNMGRAEIAATGEGNSMCFWRIDKPELKEVQTIKFGVVFKVPKTVEAIKMVGVVAAEPDMAWLSANVRDVYEALSERLRELFSKRDEDRSGAERLPVGDHERWVLSLPQ
jgi:hypothetical protein